MASDPFAQLLAVASQGVQVQAAQLRERGDLTKAAKLHGITKAGMWCRWNSHKIDHARKAQNARKWREEVMRPEWVEYCKAHARRWPDAVPCGFGRWIKDRQYIAWRVDPSAVLARPNERSLFASFEAFERAGRAAGYF